MKKLMPPLIALGAGLTVAVAGFNLLNQINPGNAPVIHLIPVGEVLEVSGEVTHRLPRSINIEPFKAPTELHHLELIMTGKNSKALLKLDEGTEIKLEENSSLVVEFDSSKEETLMATLLAGEVTRIIPGKAGALRLFRNGREIGFAKETKLPVIDGRQGDEPGAEEANRLIVAPTPDELASLTPQATPSPRPKNSAPSRVSDTLSDDEIRKYMHAQNGYFQRCFLTFLNRTGHSQEASPTKKGVVVFSFTIQPGGKTSDVSIVKTEFKDEVLNNCLIDVIGRTPFRAFDGEPIAIAEFPIALE
jgi:hypothetical protein